MTMRNEVHSEPTEQGSGTGTGAGMGSETISLDTHTDTRTTEDTVSEDTADSRTEMGSEGAVADSGPRAKMEEIVALLKQKSNWTIDTLREIAVHFKMQVVRQGETIYKTGDNPSYFYVVMEGEIEICLDSVRICRRHKGQGFGWETLQPSDKLSGVIGLKRVYSAFAMCAGRLLKVSTQWSRKQAFTHEQSEYTAPSKHDMVTSHQFCHVNTRARAHTHTHTHTHTYTQGGTVDVHYEAELVQSRQLKSGTAASLCETGVRGCDSHPSPQLNGPICQTITGEATPHESHV